MAEIFIEIFRWLWHKAFPPKPQNVAIADNSAERPLYVQMVSAERSAAMTQAIPPAQPTAALANDGGWKDMPISRSAIAGPPRGRIHPDITNILTGAGEAGAAWQDFAGLKWRATFRPALIDKAMCEMMNDYGFPIQFFGSRGGGVFPDRYRVQPGWNPGQASS